MQLESLAEFFEGDCTRFGEEVLLQLRHRNALVEHAEFQLEAYVNHLFAFDHSFHHFSRGLSSDDCSPPFGLFSLLKEGGLLLQQATFVRCAVHP